MDTANLSILQRLQANLEGVFDAYLKRRPTAEPVDTVWLGCSGGLDSVALLNIAAPWAKARGLTLKIIHINHQLSPHANDWQQHVETLVRGNGLAIINEVVNVARQGRQSLEEAARVARYAAFAKHVSHNGLLLLAHHRNDQIETLLMRLLRGSGPKGLAGMQPITTRTLSAQTLFLGRPLLSVSRAELEEYAAQRDLHWIEDESNQDERFDRNFIRNSLFPVMAKHWRERWEGMQAAMQRTAQLCAEQQESLELLLEEKLKELSSANGALYRSKLIALPSQLENDLLRYWLHQQKIALPSHAVLLQIGQLLTGSNDSQGHVAWGTHEVRVFKDSLYAFAECYQAIDCDVLCADNANVVTTDALGRALRWHIELSSRGMLLSSGTAAKVQLSAPENMSDENVQWHVRSNIGEQYFAFNSQQQAKRLKVWFKEWQVPTWHRRSVLGVFAGQQLLAVLIDADTVHLHWQANESH